MGPLLKNYKEFESGNRSLNPNAEPSSYVTEQNSYTHKAGSGYAGTKVPWAQLTLVSRFEIVRWTFLNRNHLFQTRHHTWSVGQLHAKTLLPILLAMTTHSSEPSPHQCFPVNNLAKEEWKSQDSYYKPKFLQQNWAIISKVNIKGYFNASNTICRVMLGAQTPQLHF